MIGRSRGNLGRSLSTGEAKGAMPVPPRPQPQSIPLPGCTPDATLGRACSAIDASAKDDGLQLLLGDATFAKLLPPSHVRSFFAERGADIGFDVGPEAFATMLALRLCGDLLLDCMPTLLGHARRFAAKPPRGRYNFFVTPTTFPNDTDTTSVAVVGLFEAGLLSTDALLQTSHELLQAAHLSDNVKAFPYRHISQREGVLMVYWADSASASIVRPHFDPVVVTNALYAILLAQESGMTVPAGIVEASLWYVSLHLTTGAYRLGTLYYPSPDTFLCFLSLLCRRFPARGIDLVPHLELALQRRHHAHSGSVSVSADPTNPLNMAQRIIATEAIADITGQARPQVVRHKQALAELQGPDGLWDTAPFYRFGHLELYGGNRELTALFAVRALSNSQ
jgi:hypothetical protein